jgi:hypothetical protein
VKRRTRVGVRDVHFTERDAVEEATAIIGHVVEDGALAIAERSAVCKRQWN